MARFSEFERSIGRNVEYSSLAVSTSGKNKCAVLDVDDAAVAVEVNLPTGRTRSICLDNTTLVVED